MTRFHSLPICALVTGLAASPASGQLQLGMSGGLSVSEVVLDGLDIQGEEARRGIVAGASLTVPLSGRVGVRFDGSFVQKGATWSDPKLGVVSAFVDYVQFSALGRLAVPLGGARVSLYLLAGPAVARETSCEVKVEYALHPITLEGKCTDEQTYNPTHATDLAVVGGAGVHLAVTGGVGLSLDALYSYGLRSVYAGELERTVHNRAMTARAGLVFPIG